MEKFDLLSDECLGSMHSLSNYIYTENIRNTDNAINNHCEKILFQSKYMVPKSPVDKLIEKNRMKIPRLYTESRYLTRLKKKDMISKQNCSINKVEENKLKNIKNKVEHNGILPKNYTLLPIPKKKSIHVSHSRVKKRDKIMFSQRRRSKKICNLALDKIEMEINESIDSVNDPFKLSNDTFKNIEPLNDILLLEKCHKKINKQTAIDNLVDQNSLLSPEEFEQFVSFDPDLRTKRKRRANFPEGRSKGICNLPPDKIEMEINENIDSVNDTFKLSNDPIKNIEPLNDILLLEKCHKKINKQTAIDNLVDQNSLLSPEEFEQFVSFDPDLRTKRKRRANFPEGRSKGICNLPPDKIEMEINENIDSVNDTFKLSNDPIKNIEPLNDILLLEKCHTKINKQTAIDNLVDQNSLLSHDEFEQFVSFDPDLRTKRKHRANFPEGRSKGICNLPPDKIEMEINENIDSVNDKIKSNLSIGSDSSEIKKANSLHKTYSKLPEIKEASILPDTYSEINIKQDNISLNLFENTEKAKNQTKNTKTFYSTLDKNKLFNDTLKNTEPFNNFLLEECHKKINRETMINNSELPTCTPNIYFDSSVYPTLLENNISNKNSCNTEVPYSVINEKENPLYPPELCLEMPKIKKSPSLYDISSEFNEIKNIPYQSNIHSEMSIIKEEHFIIEETQNALSQLKKCTNICLKQEIKPSDTEIIEMASFIPKIHSEMVDTQGSLLYSELPKANLELKSCPNISVKKETLPLETCPGVKTMQETPALMLKPYPETTLLNTSFQQKICSKRSGEKERSRSPINYHNKVALIDTQQSLEKEMPRKKFNHITHSEVMPVDIIIHTNNTERVESVTLKNKKVQPSAKVTISEQDISQTSSSENVKYSFKMDFSNDKMDNRKRIAKPIFIPEELPESPYHSGHNCVKKCCFCHRLLDFNCTHHHRTEIKNLYRQKTNIRNSYLIGPNSCLCAVCFGALEKQSSSKYRQMPNCVVMSCLHKIHFIMKSPFIEKIKNLLVKKGINLRSCVKNQQQLPVCNEHYNQMQTIIKCYLCGNQQLKMYEVQKSKIFKFQLILDKHEIPVTLDVNMLLCKKCHMFLSSQTNTNKHCHSHLMKLHNATIKRICMHNNCAFPPHLKDDKNPSEYLYVG